jgi:hypothetical protein
LVTERLKGVRGEIIKEDETVNKRDLENIFKTTINKLEVASKGKIKVSNLHINFVGYSKYETNLTVLYQEDSKLEPIATIKYEFDLKKQSYEDVKRNVESSFIELCMHTEKVANVVNEIIGFDEGEWKRDNNNHGCQYIV